MDKNKFQFNPIIKKINRLEAKTLTFMINRGIIKEENNSKVRKYCEKYGHEEKKGADYTSPCVEGAVTHHVCKMCGVVYEDKPCPEPAYNPFRV